MLSEGYIALVLGLLPLLSFPPGYLLINIFLRSHVSRLPFFVVLPLYLSIGFSIHIIVSFMVGTQFISGYIPIMTALLSIMMLILFKPGYRNLFRSTRPQHNSVARQKQLANVSALILFVFMFSYFSHSTVDNKWPPVGDAVAHSQLTSKIIHDGHIIKEPPFYPYQFIYPTGYHAFSADFSLITNIAPAESVYFIATFLMTVLSTLLFTLAYALTRSVWMSIPAALSVLVVHSSGYLAMWIAGFLWNGPYPNVFGYMSVISCLACLQICFQEKKQPWVSVFPIIVLLAVSILFAYPNFTFHIVVFVAVFSIIRRYDKFSKPFTSGWAILLLLLGVKETRKYESTSPLRSQFKSGYNISLSPKKSPFQYDSNLFRILNSHSFIVTLVLIVLFIVLFIVLGILPIFQQLFTFNLQAFDREQGQVYLDAAQVWRNFNSDSLYKALIALEIVCLFLIVVINKKVEPIFIAVLLLLPAMLIPQFSFIYPDRTITLVATLSWVLIAFTITELKPTTRRIFRSFTSDTIIISAFVIIALLLQSPFAVSQAFSPPGWYIFKTYDNSYETAQWIHHNINSHDLILNDRTFSSMYTEGFSSKNLTYSYWMGWTRSEPAVVTDFLIMTQDVDQIWRDPWNEQMVHDLLKKYNIKYIALFPDSGFKDFVNWGGSGEYVGKKPYINAHYEHTFSNYDFLELRYRYPTLSVNSSTNPALVYEVKMGEP